MQRVGEPRIANATCGDDADDRSDRGHCQARHDRVLRNSLATGSIVASLAFPALAQEAKANSETEVVESRIKVIVTGSNIPTLDRETALPVQTITREQDRASEHPDRGPARQHDLGDDELRAFNEAQALGGQGGDIGQAGFAAAPLRGLGYQATLVLLNGRRIANWAFTTLGADLNSIPDGRIERVEVLKNGASAIYGSDAVAGVINFILRKEFQGAEAYAQYTSPEHPGGDAKKFTVAGGYGDLAQPGRSTRTRWSTTRSMEA